MPEQAASRCDSTGGATPDTCHNTRSPYQRPTRALWQRGRQSAAQFRAMRAPFRGEPAVMQRGACGCASVGTCIPVPRSVHARTHGGGRSVVGELCSSGFPESPWCRQCALRKGLCLPVHTSGDPCCHALCLVRARTCTSACPVLSRLSVRWCSRIGGRSRSHRQLVGCVLSWLR